VCTPKAKVTEKRKSKQPPVEPDSPNPPASTSTKLKLCKQQNPIQSPARAAPSNPSSARQTEAGVHSGIRGTDGEQSLSGECGR
jgi:hypothetical protein